MAAAVEGHRDGAHQLADRHLGLDRLVRRHRLATDVARGRGIHCLSLPPGYQWPNYRDQARAIGYLAVAGIPMHLDSFRLGALNVYDRRVREHDVARGVLDQTLRLD